MQVHFCFDVTSDPKASAARRVNCKKMGGGKGKQKKEVVVALVVKKLFDGIFFRLRIISSNKKIGKVVVNIKKQQKKVACS